MEIGEDGEIEGFSFGFLDGIIIKVWQNSEEMIMQTIIEKAVGLDEDSEWLKTASKILRTGGLVAFPTETVYGLGGDALNPLASKKISYLKRPLFFFPLTSSLFLRSSFSDIPRTLLLPPDSL